MIDLALSPEEENKRTQIMQMQQAPLAAPQAPRQEKGMAGQMMDMAKQRAMSGALEAGQAGLTSGIKSALAPTVASGVEGGAMLGAGTGGMAAIGTAIPYIGAGLLAGKALGLFNEGGQVGPLSAQYHAEGSKPDYLDLDKDGNKKESMKEAAKAIQYKAQGGMTTQQAMALMNNQPDPDQLYNEIVAESMTEAAQGQMPQPKMRPPLMVDPMGADTTYSDEMYKPINT